MCERRKGKTLLLELKNTTAMTATTEKKNERMNGRNAFIYIIYSFVSFDDAYRFE